MGSRGPQPLAAGQLISDWRKRAASNNSPTITAGEPHKPADLSPEASAAWEEFASTLNEMAVLATADGLILRLLVDAVARYRTAQRELIATGGPIIASPTKQPVQNPWIWELNKSFDQLLALIRECGLSPSARSRVQAIVEQTAEDEDRW